MSDILETMHEYAKFAETKSEREAFEAAIDEITTLRARLAPVDDKALVEIASKALHEKHGGPDDETYHAIVRCTLAAIRPHIEAAEKERCVKAVEKVAERINVPLHERPAYEDGYLQGVHDAAAAIRSGK